MGLANVSFSNEVFDVGDLGDAMILGNNPTLIFTREIPTPSSAQAQLTGGQALYGCRATAVMKVNPGVTDPIAFAHVISHEIGHLLALDDCNSCPPYTSAMTTPDTTNLNEAGGSDGPTTCDIGQLRACVRTTPTPSPTPTPPESCPLWCIPPDPPPTAWSEYIDVDWCSYPPPQGGCPPGWGLPTKDSNCCWNGTPVLIDIAGDGFSLTNAENGVSFDLNNDGALENVSWTRSNSDDAWLALDRDGNGTIDNGHELFGNFTPQPQPPIGEVNNGFLALAAYDRIDNGGNEDGMISELDSVFSSLRLWRDLNHNAVSEPDELFTLDQLDVRTISVRYKVSKKSDEHGNQFRYRAKVTNANGSKLGRWAWDIILLGR